MHQSYQNTHELGVTYALYCKKMREMNISLVKLGKEECEECVTAVQHRKMTGHSETIVEGKGACPTCDRQDEHAKVAKVARNAYREDGEVVRPDTVVLAVDLQKVIFLVLL